MPLSSPIHSKPQPCLYVVATPIGNLADITLRAMTILAEVDLIAAEDTRHIRRLLTAHGIENRLMSYHEHNEAQRTPELIQRLDQGACIALVSNAGTPMVSDPGYRLVKTAIERNIPVVPIPGVSAAVAALSVSGLPTDRFAFIGFPARKKTARKRQIQALSTLPHTLIFYQSPQRLISFLRELIEILGDRPSVLAREMTKLHEEFVRGPLSDICARLETREAVKGECTLLVQGPADDIESDGKDLEEALRTALTQEDRPLSELAKTLANAFNVSKKQVYDLALRMKR